MVYFLQKFCSANEALARVKSKDEAFLEPDDEIILPTSTILFDVSGLHSAALSYRTRLPGTRSKTSCRSSLSIDKEAMLMLSTNVELYARLRSAALQPDDLL